MISIKKLLSVILSVNFFFTPVITCAEDYCAKNTKGGYIHAECADGELLKVGLYQTADFVNIENLGMSGDNIAYAFNFRALDEVFEKKKLISSDELSRKYNSFKKQCEDLSNIWTKKNILKISLSSLVGSLVGAIVGFFIRKSTNNKQTEQHINKSTKFSILKTKEFLKCLGGLIFGLASFIWLNIKNGKHKENICKEIDKLRRELINIYDSNQRNAIMLNILLFFLDRPEYITFDMVLFQDEPNNFHWDQKYAGIKYTKEELESFPAKFKEVAAKIRKNLEENHALTSDNVIFKESCINCKELEG